MRGMNGLKAVALVLALLLAITAIGAAKGGSETAETSAETLVVQPGTTVNVFADGGTSAVPWEDFKDVIQQESGIDIVVALAAQADIYTKIMAEFASGGGTYDLVVYQPAQLPEFVGLGQLRAMDDLLAVRDPKLSDIIAPFRELYNMYDGKLYALPFDGDLHVYFYRRDLVEDPTEQAAFKARYGYDLAPPATWDQHKDFCEFFTRKSGETLAGEVLAEDFFGNGMLLGRGWIHYEYLNHFAGRGGVYFDADLKPMINSEAGVAALQDLIDLVPFAPPGVLSWGFTEDRGAFASGKIASMVLWQDGFKGTYAEVVGLGGQMAAAHMPGAIVNGEVQYRATMPFGRIMSVTTTSDHPAEAFWVASFMSESASQEFVFDPRTGEDPFRYSHVNSPGRFANVVSSATGVDLSEADARAFLQIVGDNLENGYPELNLPGAAQMVDVLDLYLSRALAGELAPKAALDEVAAEWNAINNNLGFDRQKDIWLGTLATWERLGYASGM